MAYFTDFGTLDFAFISPASFVPLSPGATPNRLPSFPRTMPAVPSEEQHERHEANQTTQLKDRRFKLNRACDRCRRRRIRCEESTPCASCVAAGSPCTFEESGKKTHPHKSRRTSTLEERIAQLEALIQGMPANIFQSTTPATPATVVSPTTNGATPITFQSLGAFQGFGVPPPGLSTAKLTNPATHFIPPALAIDSMTSGATSMALSPTYLYWDDEGFTRWQGAASGLPLLDLLVERNHPQLTAPSVESPTLGVDPKCNANSNCEYDFFPDRPLKRRVTINPEMLWKTVTASIPPDLMDGLVQSYLSTTFYLMPFLHVPTFLHDYSNPTKWGEPGFVSFVTAVCCLASRHVDDPRVREDPKDPFTCGTHWFGLFNKLHSLPLADRPTLYTVQAVLVAGIYAIGLGRLSKGFALLSEAITLSFDAGLHRSLDAYDCFDPIESEVRKRTFWAVYLWDKQIGAAFGRPPLIRLRDCDVAEPTIADDEGVAAQSTTPSSGSGASPRMAAFMAAVRYFVVLESVLDAPPALDPNTTSSFLKSAANTLIGFGRSQDMHEEEMLLDEATNLIPAYWQYHGDGQEATLGDDVIQTTQCHRLHCLEQWVRLLIHRHRLTVALSSGSNDEEMEVQEMIGCHQTAVNIIHSQLQMATHGLMGFFGVGAIHQLNSAGRTLVAVLLNCNSKSPFLQQQLVGPGLEALRSCVVLLRRFSVRYLCGLRSADLIEEFCRVSRIPLDAPQIATNSANPASRRAWLRPIKKKGPSIAGSATSPSENGSAPGTGTVNDTLVDPMSQTLGTPSSMLASSGTLPPTTMMNTPSPGHVAFEAYEALMNSNSNQKPANVNGSIDGINGKAGGGMNGVATGTYTPMDGRELLGVTSNGSDDILALLSNSNFEPPFDFGMLYSTDGNAAGGNGTMNFPFDSASPSVFGGLGGLGTVNGPSTFDQRESDNKGYNMGSV